MAYYRTFPIGDLISKFALCFSETCLFLNKESQKGFISYFVFPLKKIIKISGDSNFLFKNFFFNKKRVSPSSGDAHENYIY